MTPRVELPDLPGWSALSRGDLHVVVRAGGAVVDRLTAAAEDGDVDELLDALAQDGLRRTPDFVVVLATEPVRVVARGTAYAVLTTPAGQHEVRAPARGPWADEDGPLDVGTVELRTGEEGPDAVGEPAASGPVEAAAPTEPEEAAAPTEPRGPRPPPEPTEPTGPPEPVAPAVASTHSEPVAPVELEEPVPSPEPAPAPAPAPRLPRPLPQRLPRPLPQRRPRRRPRCPGMPRPRLRPTRTVTVAAGVVLPCSDAWGARHRRHPRPPLRRRRPLRRRPCPADRLAVDPCAGFDP